MKSKNGRKCKLIRMNKRGVKKVGKTLYCVYTLTLTLVVVRSFSGLGQIIEDYYGMSLSVMNKKSHNGRCHSGGSYCTRSLCRKVGEEDGENGDVEEEEEEGVKREKQEEEEDGECHNARRS